MNRPDAYRRRLSLRIWFRDTSQRYRFCLFPDDPQGLVIEPITESGSKAFFQQLQTLWKQAPQGTPVRVGGLLADDDGRFLFYGSNLDESLLEELAAWAKSSVQSIPSVTGLIDAAVVSADVDVKDDEALRSFDPGRFEIHRNATVWDSLLVPETALTADVLSSREPGERMWYWMSPVAEPPLLVQPIDCDPTQQRMDHLVSWYSGEAVDEAAAGICTLVDDGRIQFTGNDLRPSMLNALAAWVRENVDEHPALARLSNCQFLSTHAGKVSQVTEDESLWTDLARPAVSGTLQGAAMELEQLGEGDTCWFWMTAHGNGGPFLYLTRATDEAPEGEIADRLTSLFDRFPGSAQDAVFGTLNRLPSGTLLFSSPEPREEAWKSITKSLAESGANIPGGFSGLATARFIQVSEGQITGVC